MDDFMKSLKGVTGEITIDDIERQKEKEKTIPVDVFGFDEATTQEKKIFEEYRGKYIANEKEIGSLFLRSLFVSMMGEVGQSLQTNFVDIPRRDSARLAAEWGIPEKERQIEGDLSKIIQTAIDSFRVDIDRLIDDGAFD